MTSKIFRQHEHPLFLINKKPRQFETDQFKCDECGNAGLFIEGCWICKIKCNYQEHHTCLEKGHEHKAHVLVQNVSKVIVFDPTFLKYQMMKFF